LRYLFLKYWYLLFAMFSWSIWIGVFNL